MKFIVNYMPENLSETQCQMIRDNINESMSSNESCHAGVYQNWQCWTLLLSLADRANHPIFEIMLWI